MCDTGKTKSAENNEQENEESDKEDDDFVLPNHFRCAAHTLNLIGTTDIKNTLKVNPDLQSHHDITVKKCVLLWNKQRSPQQSEILTKYLGC